MKEQRAEAAILKNRLGEAEEELLKYSASPTPSLMTALRADTFAQDLAALLAPSGSYRDKSKPPVTQPEGAVEFLEQVAAAIQRMLAAAKNDVKSGVTYTHEGFRGRDY